MDMKTLFSIFLLLYHPTCMVFIPIHGQGLFLIYTPLTFAFSHSLSPLPTTHLHNPGVENPEYAHKTLEKGAAHFSPLTRLKMSVNVVTITIAINKEFTLKLEGRRLSPACQKT